MKRTTHARAMNLGGRLWLAMAAALFASSTSNAEEGYIITTNMNGADVELREQDINPNTDPFWGPVGAPRGVNRGTSTELATRARDSTANIRDHTSVMYLKFDISDANGVTDALLGLADRTPLRLTTRNAADLTWNRTHTLDPYYGSLPADDTNPEFVTFASDPANYTRVKFNIYGLTNFSHPNYNWSESGIAATWNPDTSPAYGPEGSITWYNSPGITPDSRLSSSQDPGKYNFNSDMEWLGTATLNSPGLPHAMPPPYPPLSGADSSALPVGGMAIQFLDADGKLHDLIEAARLAGQTHVTVAVAFALDTFENATGETAQTTPSDFLDFNYLVNPKEMDANPFLPGLQLNDDPIWDPDWSDNAMMPDPTPVGPGPHSAANNDDGRFSPQLKFYISDGGHWLNTSNTDNEWSRDSNWASGMWDDYGEAIFDIYDTYTVSIDGAQLIGSMEVTGGWVTLDFNGHALDVGCITIARGAALTFNAGAPGSMLETSSIAVANGGRLSGRGDVTVTEGLQNDGTIGPGDASQTGGLKIFGNMTQSDTGKLKIDIGGYVRREEFDQITVSGNATLGGVLDLTLINDDFAPQWGDRFEVLLATGDLVNGGLTLAPDDQAEWRLHWIHSAFWVDSLAVEYVPGLPGDFNGDGSVDAADYVVWRKTDGTQADYETWRANFGRIADSGAADVAYSSDRNNVGIPEPGTFWLAMGAAIIGLRLLVNSRHERAINESSFRLDLVEAKSKNP
jgi:hypothetical protein